MNASLQNLLNKRKREYRAWLKRESTLLRREADIELIKQDVSNDTPGKWLNIADSLNRLGTWHAIKGIVELDDGQIEQGWIDIHSAWIHISQSLRVRFYEFSKGLVLGRFRRLPSLELESSLYALSLAYSLVFQCKSQMILFGDIVYNILTDERIVPKSHWSHHGLEAYVYHLLSKLLCGEGGHDTVLDCVIPCYRRLINAWNNPDEMVLAIGECADYHCRQIVDESEERIAEFRSPPFDIIPVELMAIYAVRSRSSLATPAVVHPLLKEVFVQPVGDPMDVDVPIVTLVESHLNK